LANILAGPRVTVIHRRAKKQVREDIDKAQKTFFADGGVFDQIYKP